MSQKIHIYNTLTKSLEEFEPVRPGSVSMYVCGPTVYSDIHMHFEVSGKVDEKKLQKAADHSVEKYCSVVKMLEPTVNITHSVGLK